MRSCLKKCQRNFNGSGVFSWNSQIKYADHDGDDNWSALLNWLPKNPFLERDAGRFPSTTTSTRPYVGGSFLVLGGLAETGCASSTTTTTTPPLYGWCKGKHRPKVPAQSGHRGYCKACFGKLFPDEAKGKSAARKKQCSICRGSSEMADAKLKICKPCYKARKCWNDGCANVNLDRKALVCGGGCHCKREAMGAG